MKVIFNADDFGVGSGINSGIADAFNQGILTSTTIRTNGVAFSQAVRLKKNQLRNIGLGIHLNLTDGKAQSKELADAQGLYKYKFADLLRHFYLPASTDFFKTIEQDLEIQFGILINSGIIPDHVDSEEHVHMIPGIFEIICRLCKKYHIKYIRLVREPIVYCSPKHSLRQWENFSFLKHLILSTFIKHNLQIMRRYRLQTTEAYFGILYTNQMDSEVILTALKTAQNNRYSDIEIASHPATILANVKETTSMKFAKYANLPNREIERNALLDDGIKIYLKEKKIVGCRFFDLENIND